MLRSIEERKEHKKDNTDERKLDKNVQDEFDAAFMRSEEDQEEEEAEQEESLAQPGGNESDLIDEEEEVGTPRAENMTEFEALQPNISLRIRDVVDEIHNTPFQNNEGAAQLGSITRSAEGLLKVIDRKMPLNPTLGDAERWKDELEFLLVQFRVDSDNYIREHVRPRSREGKLRKRWVTLLGTETDKIQNIIADCFEGAVSVEGKDTWGEAVAATFRKDEAPTEAVGGEPGEAKEDTPVDDFGRSFSLDQDNTYDLLQTGFELLRDNPQNNDDEIDKESSSVAVVQSGALQFMQEFAAKHVVGDEEELMDMMDDYVLKAREVANAGNTFLREHRFTKTPVGRARKSGVAAITRFAELLRDTASSGGNMLIRAYLDDIQEVERKQKGENRTVGIVLEDLIRQYLGPNGIRKWNGSVVI